MKRGDAYEISLEGSCYSGKSTLAKALSKQFCGQFIPEYSYFDPSFQRRKKFPPHSIDDSLDSFKYFLNLDLNRTYSISTNQDKLFFLDRSIVSVIAFEYAKLKVGIPNIFNQVNDLIKHHLERATLPSEWIYLRFDSLNTLKLRVQSHDIGLRFMVEKNTVQNLQTFYKVFFTELGQYSITISTESSPRLQLEQASNFINDRLNSKDKITPQIFMAALNNTQKIL